jgi:hypothetical protein
MGLGDGIDVKVDVRPYLTSHSKPMYQLNIRSESRPEGEELF